MTHRRGPGNRDLPIVIKEAEKAYERDLKPAVHLITGIADILFGPGPVKPAPTPPAERERPRPTSVRLPPAPANQIVITEIKQKPDREAQSRARAPSEPHIIEAEIIEESGFPRICPTCGGAGRLGRAGHEVPCPSCNWPR